MTNYTHTSEPQDVSRIIDEIIAGLIREELRRYEEKTRYAAEAEKEKTTRADNDGRRI